MKLDFSADRLISMGIILLKAIIILVAGHYITPFLIKLMKRSLNRINIDISLEKFFEKALYITLHIIIILSALKDSRNFHLGAFGGTFRGGGCGGISAEGFTQQYSGRNNTIAYPPLPNGRLCLYKR